MSKTKKSKSIKDIGGEFALIKRLTRKIKDKNVRTQIGDDAAVIQIKDKILVISSDMIVEDDHFSLKWSSAEQIGRKAMEVNVSDIGAKGAVPKYALVSICVPRNIDVDFMDNLYKGLYKVCDKYNFEIIGGDMTHGKQIVIDVMIIGEVTQKNLCLRSTAKEGDLILVTGYLGKSAAGLELLRKGLKGEDIKKNIEPVCRLDKSKEIAPFVRAMIDVSDGLAAEVNHICEMSKTGAVVYKKRIPIAKSTVDAAKKLGKDAYDFALSGGEDFELVFTIPKSDYENNIELFDDCFVVGEILEKKKGIILKDKDLEIPLKGGYDHFRK